MEHALLLLVVEARWRVEQERLGQTKTGDHVQHAQIPPRFGQRFRRDVGVARGAIVASQLFATAGGLLCGGGLLLHLSRSRQTDEQQERDSGKGAGSCGNGTRQPSIGAR
jgi:hypothetical protein